MHRIKKGDVHFSVSEKGYWRDWFKGDYSDNEWEPETFKVLNYFSDNKKKEGVEEKVEVEEKDKGIYIDIGAWVGPTVLYASRLYKQVFALEPDPVANRELKWNLEVNPDISNVCVIDKALSDKNCEMLLGGNGALGNSQSTLLVNHERFFKEVGEITIYNAPPRASETVQVSAISFETFLNEYKLELDRVSLIKIDIEGGEWIVVPALLKYFKTLNTKLPPIYLSLHWMFLKKDQIHEVLVAIFSSYKECYNVKTISDKELGDIVNIDTIMAQHLDSLVFL